MKNQTNYIKVSSYEGKIGQVKKVVLLYSGGLDTSVMIKWIQEVYKAQVIALTVDIGQQADNLEEIRQKALKLAAVKAYVIDAKDEFANEYIAKGIKANASYQGNYHLSTPLGRPLLAKWAVKIAIQEGADCIAHGCTGKGNDQVRIEGAALALMPDIKIIAPVREWSMGRDEEIEYARKHGIPIKQTKEIPYSWDDNMWGLTGEGGEIENPSLIPPLEKILQICSLPENAPLQPEIIKLEFIKGIPVALNGKIKKLSDIIFELNKIGARHGVGTTIHIEDRVIGLKVRGVYEAPAAEIIISAHKVLEKYVSTRVENEFKEEVDIKWGYLCYGGLWYEPLMEDLNAFIDHMNQKVNGLVTLKLYKGRVDVVAIETPNTIFREKLATFNVSEAFNQNVSAGFIELYTLQMRLSQQKEKTVLLTVGKRKNKLLLKEEFIAFKNLGFKIYATYKTYKFLKNMGIEAILVHKISEFYKKPNLLNLLEANRFDLIINIPTRRKTHPHEKTDGQIIREYALKNKTMILTEISMVKNLIKKLNETHVR